MSLNFTNTTIGSYLVVPSITVKDEEGNTTTYYERKTGDYIVMTKDADGRLQSNEIVEKKDALKDFMHLATDKDTESISYKDAKGTKTVSVDENGKYNLFTTGYPGLSYGREVSETGAMQTVLGMMEDVDMLEGKKTTPIRPGIIYNMEYSA